MILSQTNNLREYGIIHHTDRHTTMTETTQVDCISCNKSMTELVVGGKPLNRICRTCAATQ